MTTLEQITGTIGTCKYLLCNLIGINSKVNINALIIIAKNSSWDAWPDPECASGYKTAFKIQAEISLWDTPYFRHWNNILIAKASLQKLLMKLQ